MCRPCGFQKTGSCYQRDSKRTTIEIRSRYDEIQLDWILFFLVMKAVGCPESSIREMELCAQPRVHASRIVVNCAGWPRCVLAQNEQLMYFYTFKLTEYYPLGV